MSFCEVSLYQHAVLPIREPGVGVSRFVEDFLILSFLHNSSKIHNRNTVSQIFNHAKIMGYER